LERSGKISLTGSVSLQDYKIIMFDVVKFIGHHCFEPTVFAFSLATPKFYTKDGRAKI